jgi:hypothetical protein
MKIAIAVGLVLAGSALSACTTTTGPKALNDPGAFQAFEVHPPTKREVHAAFGQPHEVTRSGPDRTVWLYVQITARTNPSGFIPYVGLVTGGKDLSVTKAEFVFDRDDRLTTSRRLQQEKYLNQWVQLADTLTPRARSADVATEMKAYGLAFDRKAARKAASWADAVN